MSEIGDILQKATEVLDTKGWCQKRLRNDEGAVCAYGAIITVLNDHGLYNSRHKVLIDEISNALYSHLPEFYKRRTCKWYAQSDCVIDFNNNSHATVDDVKDLFAKTIADEGVSLS